MPPELCLTLSNVSFCFLSNRWNKLNKILTDISKFGKFKVHEVHK